MAGPRVPSQLLNDDGSEAAVATAPPDAEHLRLVEQLFERYRRPLLRYLSGLLGGRADAEDLAQEAYSRLLGTPTLDRSPARARAYLFKTATNLVRDRFRRTPHRLCDTLDLLPADPCEIPERIVDFEQGLDAVRRALLELKPRCREVFLLRAVEGLDYGVIAERLGIGKRTVERDMKHALDACQQRLKRAWK